MTMKGIVFPIGMLMLLLAAGVSSASVTTVAGGGPLPVTATDAGYTYCPPVDTHPFHAVVATCAVTNFYAVSDSTVLVVVGANLSANDPLTVQDTAGERFAFIAGHIYGPENAAIFLYSAHTIGGLVNDTVFVNLSIPTRYMVTLVDLRHTDGEFSVGAAAYGIGPSVSASVPRAVDGSALILVVYDNETDASAFCGFRGTMFTSNVTYKAIPAGTYRNLIIGVEPYTGVSGRASLTAAFGNTPLFNTQSCTDADSVPYSGFLVSPMPAEGNPEGAA